MQIEQQDDPGNHQDDAVAMEEEVDTPAEGNDGTVEVSDDQPAVVVWRDSGERPVFKLSVKLLDTYKHINKVKFFCTNLIFKKVPWSLNSN